MNIDEHIEYWLESAGHDLGVADTLFENAKYDWCLFLGHLVLEKTLKALYLKDNPTKLPPRTHNLVRLAEHTTTIEWTDEQKAFLDEINDFHLEVRYPDYKRSFYKQCNRDYAIFYLTGIKEYYTWIKSILRSEK